MRKASLFTAAVTVLALGGCGSSGQEAGPAGTDSAARTTTITTTTAVPHAHPQAVEPVAGSASHPSGGSRTPTEVSVGPPSGHLAQPVSLSTIRRELSASGISASATRATLTSSGLAIPPANAPSAVQELIAAGNEIAHLPYRFGGGHGTFEDTAYDCSGSLSFVFAAAGLLDTTVTSGQLMSWGRPGPGHWITVFAAPGHTFMYVAGLRFDTVALAETGSRWSSRAADEPNLGSFVQRHPVGL